MKDDRGDLDLTNQIEQLQARVKDLEEINQSHKQLNGELRRDNGILADEVATLQNRLNQMDPLGKLRKKGLM
jgi:peptidoglycan hydrolase CwlO-like protein